ncbi:hypothetical protein UA75_20065 [Actinoalloteichus sp. GBA129-24]|nr:hypothetical protein UA75_20065 [Actinoalloteichus sp. GBA129-24]
MIPVRRLGVSVFSAAVSGPRPPARLRERAVIQARAFAGRAWTAQPERENGLPLR